MGGSLSGLVAGWLWLSGLLARWIESLICLGGSVTDGGLFVS